MIAAYLLVFWLAASTPLGAWLKRLHMLDEMIDQLVLLAILAGLMIIWRWRHGFSFRALMGPWPGWRAAAKAIVTGLMMVLLTLGTLYAIGWPLSLVAPDYMASVLAEPAVEFDYSTLQGVFVAVLLALVLAPLIEELVFRGVLMQRWSARYGMRLGIVLSAVLFSVAHPASFAHIPGAIVLGLEYWFTRSLVAAMLVHAANNAVIAALEVAVPGFMTEKYSLAEFREDAPLGLALFAIALVYFVPYFRKRWPKAGEVIPYERNCRNA